ncbi:Peptide chain release factor 2 [Slackia heliotrinireducens]|uniref:Peptide chain release factor 2 n=1 Tax=Slackia heliotrinireducens (strain ATCC 29202 / DSM 20476 / NCTC 11029 / RHS 1) TaxID=471855 RepID=C7N4W1_SLAHD|nr:peptide chain release factor 2 [Slackia heliotrinireducens]ACV21946.1 peptide chain release factor 2 [Slackia heliotrinireducens DSM 20476]VEG99790.1 Peptide chain release factor 2 [Slackia heliotrinireducens]
MAEEQIQLASLDELAERVAAAREYRHINENESLLEKLNEEIASPDFWNDSQNALQVSKRASEVRSILDEYEHVASLLEDARTADELSADDEMFAEERDELRRQLSDLLDGLEVSSWFSGEMDPCDAIVSINPGQGGLEAQDWVDMLYKMYSKYAEKKGWKVRLLDITPGEVIGLDRAVIQIEGKNAYGMLRSENGVHRLVRISPTDDKKRRQTTFAGVEVLPVVDDEIEVDLNVNDVRVDVYRSSGPGGQCVNTTDSAVRLTHIPTGIVVTCQNQKSQLQNKDAAFKVLRAKLYELERQKREEEIDALRGERMDNSFGSQIRNYVLYPYQLVKDLRSGIETGNVDAVLSGDIEEFVIGYHRWRVAQRLA